MGGACLWRISLSLAASRTGKAARGLPGKRSATIERKDIVPRPTYSPSERESRTMPKLARKAASLDA